MISSDEWCQISRKHWWFIDVLYGFIVFASWRSMSVWWCHFHLLGSEAISENVWWTFPHCCAGKKKNQITDSLQRLSQICRWFLGKKKHTVYISQYIPHYIPFNDLQCLVLPHYILVNPPKWLVPLLFAIEPPLKKLFYNHWQWTIRQLYYRWMLHKHLNFWWGISHCCLINYLYWSLIQFKPQWNINMVGYTLQYYLQHTFPTIYGLYPKKSQDSCEYYGGWLRNPASPWVVETL